MVVLRVTQRLLAAWRQQREQPHASAGGRPEVSSCVLQIAAASSDDRRWRPVHQRRKSPNRSASARASDRRQSRCRCLQGPFSKMGRPCFGRFDEHIVPATRQHDLVGSSFRSRAAGFGLTSIRRPSLRAPPISQVEQVNPAVPMSCTPMSAAISSRHARAGAFMNGTPT